MKKIVFYINGIYNGGTEIALLSLIMVLDKNKYDIHIISENLEKSNTTIVKRMKELAKVTALEKMEADVLIFCNSPKNETNEILKNIRFKKSYFWFHYFSKSQLDFLAKVNKEKIVDNIIVVCNTVKENILKLEMYRDIEDNIISIYNILQIDYILEKSKEKVEIENSTNLNLITVARLCKEKGFYRMKHLIDCMNDKGIDFKWHILGCASNEADHKEIDSLINCYPGKVIMYGYQENPYKYISKCDYLVLLSDEENMPYVVVEAKALGIPCILTNFDSAYEQVVDMKNGIILEKNDLTKYEDRINDILFNKEKFKNEVMKYEYSNSASIDKWDELLDV